MPLFESRRVWREIVFDQKGRRLVRMYRLPTGESWSIPWDDHRTEDGYGWWSKALARANQAGVGVEVVTVTRQGQAGFRFHVGDQAFPPRRAAAVLRDAKDLRDRVRADPGLLPEVEPPSRTYAEVFPTNRELAAELSGYSGSDLDLWMETNMGGRD